MTSAPNSGKYVDFDEYVGLKLEKTRSTIRTTDLLTTLAGLAAMFLGYLLVFVILDQWAVSDGFSPLWRWILLSTLMISTIAWLILKVGIPSLQSVNRLFAAKEIEDAEPDLKGSLLNLVDLKTAGRPINPTILKALERQTALRLQKVNIDQAIDHRPLIRTAYLLLAIITVFCVYALLSPKKISNSIWRGLLPGSQVAASTVTEIVGDVRPGDIRIPAHQPSVEIQVDLAGKTPDKVQVVYSTLDGKQGQEVELHSEEEGRYRGQILGDGSQGLVNDVKYFVRAGDAKSRVYTITVEQPPYAEIEMVRLESPAYMKLVPSEQLNTPAIDAWEGTKAVVTAKTNMPVSAAMIQFLDDPQAAPTGEEVPMSLSSGGRQVQGAWTLAMRSDGTSPKFYRIHCKTADGRATTGHVNFPLLVKPDQPPEVAIIQPDRDINLPMNGTLSLLIQARDPDFELGYIYLNVEKDGRRVGRDQLSEGRQQKIALRHNVAVSRWSPAVGDTYEIWVEAYDNKQPRPNSRNTPKFKVKIVEPVSPKEAEQQLADQKEKIDQQVAKSSPDQNQDQREGGEQRDANPDRRPHPNEQDANQNEVAQQDNAQQPQQGANQAGQKEKSGQSGSKSNQASDRGQQQPGNARSTENSKDGDAKEQPAEGGQGGKEGNQEKPLRNDGSQDFEALKKINDLMKNRPQPSDSPNENQPPEGDSTQEPNQSSQQKSAEQSKQKTGTEKPSKAGKPTEEQKKAGSDGQKNESPDGKESNQDRAADGQKTKSAAQQKSDPKTRAGDQRTKREDQSTDDSAKPNSATNPSEQKPESGDEKGASDSKSGASKDQRAESNQKNETSEKPKQSADEKNQDSRLNSDQQQGDNQSADGTKETAKPEKSEGKGKSADGKKADKDNDEQAGSDEAGPDEPKEQVPDAAESKKGDADGTEKGRAKPDRAPNSKSKTTKNDNVKRDPNEKPEVRPNDSQQDSAADSKEDGQPSNESGKSSSKGAQSKPDAKAQQKQGTSKDKDSSSSKASDANQDSDDAGQSESSQNEKQSGKSSNKDSQKSEQPSKGSKEQSGSQSDKKSDKSSNSSKEQQQDGNAENGEQQSADDASPSSEKSSDGKSGSKSDSQKSSDQKSAQKGSQSGSKSQEGKSDSGQKGGDDKAGEKSGGGQAEQKSQGQGQAPSNGEGEGGPSSSPKAGSQSPGTSKPSGNSSKSGKQGDQAGQNTGNAGGENGPEPDSAPSEKGDETGPARGDEANLEFNRQATELVLEKLQKELDRGEVDEDLLRQLGWSESDLKRFASRMSKSLQESKKPDETPASKARQLQFEEMLKNLDLKGSGSARSGESEPKRDVQQIESKRTPPPSGYKSAFEKFTRDMNRQTPSKSKPATK